MCAFLYCLTYIILFKKCICGYRFQNIPINNQIGGVLETYLKPISKLSELFPNQQVEVQLEIDGSNYVPKQYLRQSETTMLPSSSSSITTPTVPRSSTNSAVNDRPVYMSDLKKVFDDFEKKHIKLHDDVKQVPFVNIKQTVGNLNDLLGLLKKGVQVEKSIGKPTGKNVSWFQIKIPRN
ncbi:uncharacterized protein LOC123713621 isoform X2 [Pieris brassicae]|uniref:uncharacterized protein LOC123713621 isoform X2 n=1 Tax=Pieris brassicae TaxID=7116 RepID=UPI001E6604B6|nr:uncharacterized protein LOC123713621 isoform X2 [Pieris brassicae]